MIDKKWETEFIERLQVHYDELKWLYYELYHRYNELYKIPEILEGRFPEDKESLRNGSFDEKLSIIGLLTDKLMEEFRTYAEDQAVQKKLFETIKEFRSFSETEETETASSTEWFRDRAGVLQYKIDSDKEAGMISREDERIGVFAVKRLHECASYIGTAAGSEPDLKSAFILAKNWFTKQENNRQARIKVVDDHLTNCFNFIEETFGNKESLSGSQEMVIFITELSNAYYSLKFVKDVGNDAYYQYNKLLLLNDRKQELREKLQQLEF